MTPEERVAGLSPQQRLAGMSSAEKKRLLKLLEHEVDTPGQAEGVVRYNHTKKSQKQSKPRVEPMQTELARTKVQRLLRQIPFRPFALNMENGDHVIIDHPENIAFQPGGDGAGSADFYVLSERLRIYGAFESVTSVALVDRGE